MPPSLKTKAGLKAKHQKKSSAAPAEPIPSTVEASESDPEGSVQGSDNSDDDSDDEGVDEAGMERLMKALGDDGLDDFDREQLNLLENDEDWSTEDEDAGSDEEEAASADEDEEDVEASDEEDEEDEAVGEEETGNAPSDTQEDVALDDVESADEDVVPRQKIEIDNQVALKRIRETIQLDPSFPWTETLVIPYPETISVDVDDDLNRELSFYKQALHAANTARSLAAKHSFPFTRPADYFAEMVKSDSHMERIRQRLLDEGAGIKRSEEKRREREGKKFGKQVQLEKLKEREKGKKDMEERLKGLKRKRKDVLDNPQAEDDAFDVAVEDAISDRPAKRGRMSSGDRGSGSRGSRGGRGGARMTRDSRDQKFGFGGADRRSKQNTRESTDDFGSRGRRGAGGRGGSRGGRGSSRGGGGSRGGGSRGGSSKSGGSKRVGKERRISARSKV